MSWLNHLELKFGHFAIPGLIRIVAAFNALCYVLAKLRPEFAGFLTLEPERIMHGEIWRLVTYVFMPGIGGVVPDWFWEVVYIFYLIAIGEGLERAWGPFKLNVYFLLGMIGTTIAAFFLGANFSGTMLHASIFFAYAYFFADSYLHIFWVLPIRVRWLAWASALGIAVQMINETWEYRAAVLVCLANYLLFFGRGLVEEARQRQVVMVRRAQFERGMRESLEETLHCCKVCGRTEETDQYLEFRVAADGEEYCADHLPKPPAAN